MQCAVCSLHIVQYAVHILLGVNKRRLVQLLYACACGSSHTVAHCGTLWHTAAHCGTLWHTVAHCDTLWHTVASAFAGKLGFPLVGASPPHACWTSSINIITQWHEEAF